jgi:hypothetical protein
MITNQPTRDKDRPCTTCRLTPLWYVFDGEDFLFTMGGATTKALSPRRKFKNPVRFTADLHGFLSA